jgi:Spy/CpxP family protein refolding chaperone
MFCSSLLLGALGGVLGAKLVTRRHFGGFSRWVHRRGRGFGGPGLFRAVHALGLDRRQKDELWSIAREVRQTFGDVKIGGLQGADTLIDAITADSFDRAAVDAAAQKQGDAVGALRDRLVKAAERIHQILTPEQRQRLRAMLGGAHDPGPGPDGGPYRTAL